MSVVEAVMVSEKAALFFDAAPKAHHSERSPPRFENNRREPNIQNCKSLQLLRDKAVRNLIASKWSFKVEFS